MLRPPPHQTAARGRKKTHLTAASESPSLSLPPRGSTTPRVIDHHLQGSTSTSPSLSSSHHRLQGSSSASSSLSSSLSLPQRSSTITGQIIVFEFHDVDEVGCEASKHLAMDDNQFMVVMSKTSVTQSNTMIPKTSVEKIQLDKLCTSCEPFFPPPPNVKKKLSTVRFGMFTLRISRKICLGEWGSKKWRVEIKNELAHRCRTTIGREWLTFVRENQLLVGDHVVFRVLPSTMGLVLVGVYRHNPATPPRASSSVRPHEDQDLSEVVQKLNDVIKLRNEELEAKEETIRKLRNEELEAKEETIRKLSERLLSELGERLLLEQRISGLVKSQADKRKKFSKNSLLLIQLLPS
ncbi:hypothetical protein PRUPE_8G260200 [Prunus persica]|uniref:TF-B3 domain-containing protein n=1 Tax=Prunus persica TaxID=3760 RepID=A0A251N3L7_PRUPE|nr:hypothetical protein PRUPE_8G260200 [Prunus persica]ONH93916.1 hypothetical protein PRUPE_8G260200 [Prunus persica]